MSRVLRMATPQAQLDLFTPRPNVPQWCNLPRTARQTIKAHLATLIRHRAARLRKGKEANDER